MIAKCKQWLIIWHELTVDFNRQLSEDILDYASWGIGRLIPSTVRWVRCGRNMGSFERTQHDLQANWRVNRDEWKSIQVLAFEVGWA
jgi:hypothetical protein